MLHGTFLALNLLRESLILKTIKARCLRDTVRYSFVTQVIGYWGWNDFTALVDYCRKFDLALVERSIQHKVVFFFEPANGSDHLR